MSFDELRRGVKDTSFEDEIDDDLIELEEADRATRAEERRFLGMTAVERMFLSMFLFLAVTVLGIALLLATGRLAL